MKLTKNTYFYIEEFFVFPDTGKTLWWKIRTYIELDKATKKFKELKKETYRGKLRLIREEIVTRTEELLNYERRRAE